MKFGMHKHFWTAAFAFGLATLSVNAEKAREITEEDAPGHAFFKKNCAKYHNAKKHKGDFQLDQFSLQVTDENHELWEEVVHNLQRGDMPPEAVHGERTPGPWRAGRSSPFRTSRRGQKVPQFALFDLSKDPAEKNNLSEKNPMIFAKMKAELQKFLDDGRSR